MISKKWRRFFMLASLRELRVLGLALTAGLWVGAASAQATTSARDLKTGCMVADIPAAVQLSITWTGDCEADAASGVGFVYGFSQGELRYLLRGRFNAGHLNRRDQLLMCDAGACADQVAAAVINDHRNWARQQPVVSPVAGVTAGANQLVAQSTAKAAEPAPAPSPQRPAAGGARPEIRAPDAVYRGDFRVDQTNGAVSGRGQVEFNDGRRYDGQIVGGRRMGHGVYVWTNGQKYDGEWRDDLQDGQGVWTSPQGDRYVGQFRGGRRQGQGEMQFANKSVYSGDWVADEATGQGRLEFPNGDVYEGQFVNGEQTGQGSWKNARGDRYSGQWVRGQRQGQGVADWQDGLHYDGEWAQDRRNGQGSIRFPDGGTYVGPWKDDVANGEGSLSFASGDSYVGEIRDGKPNGRGLYRWGSGDQFVGEFADGRPTDKGSIRFQTEQLPAKAEAAEGAASADGAVAPASRATLCSKAYNAARTVVALRRFIESFPADECARHALARQKMAAIEAAERKPAGASDDRIEQAKALVGLAVVYRQEFAFCVNGSGANCQRVPYQFEVKGRIKEVDLNRQGVQVQVQAVTLLGNDKGAPTALFNEGRAAADSAFRERVLGSVQFKTKAEVGLSF